MATGRAVVVGQPLGVVEDGVLQCARGEVPQVAREAAADATGKAAGEVGGGAILQGGPDITRAGAFRRQGFALVVGVTHAEVDRAQGAGIEVLAEVGGEPLLLVLGGDFLVAPGAEAGDTGRADVAADVPVDGLASAVRGPVGAATVGSGHFSNELTRSRAGALGAAGLELGVQGVIDLPIRIGSDVAALGGGFAVDHVVHGIIATGLAGEVGVGQHAVLDHVAGIRRLARTGDVAVVVLHVAHDGRAPQHEVAVVVVGIHLRAEAFQAQRQVVSRLELQCDQAAFAFAGLLEQGRTQQAGGVYAGQVRVALRNRAVRVDLEEARRDFLCFAAQLTLLAESLHHHAEGAFVVLVVEQARQLRIIGLGRIRTHGTDGGFGGDLVGEFQRLAGDDVDGAGGAAVLQFGLRGLVHFHRADQLGRQQGVADAAAHVAALAEHEPVGRADGVAVDQGLGEAGAGAAQADAVGFVEAAFVGAGRADVDARQALQGVGDIVRRQLADIFGGDHFNA
ncbi:hypothetical protein D3C81_1026280 [compost metagenome]